QVPAPSMAIVVRSSAPVTVLAPALRQIVWDLDKQQPVSNIMTMEQVMYNQGGGAGSQLIGELLGIFAALGLMLASVGIYGLISYVVVQRTHEFGIRLALGAARGDIVGLVLGEGGRLAVFGLVIGGLGAAAVPRALASVFSGLAVGAWAAVLLALAVLAVVALSACYLPARRAMKVDPMVALRYE
ncbi:MAG TPA: FtsX-like permease family protein, partial [Terriglobales bacterium]|nr:FtsX-like permease family protein [Terriglobales bacterium]